MKRYYLSNTTLSSNDAPYELEYDLGNLRATHPNMNIEETAKIESFERAGISVKVFDDGTHLITRMNKDETVVWGNMTIIEKFPSNSVYKRISYNHKSNNIIKEKISIDEHVETPVWDEHVEYSPVEMPPDDIKVVEKLEELIDGHDDKFSPIGIAVEPVHEQTTIDDENDTDDLPGFKPGSSF